MIEQIATALIVVAFGSGMYLFGVFDGRRQVHRETRDAAMGSYAMLARPLPPNVTELSDEEMHEMARLLDQPVEFVALAGGRN